jgi:hypothetical protein
VLDTQLRDFLLAVREDLDPTFLFERVIGPADPWQQELLAAHDEFILVLASRQVGKSTGIACLVWHLLAQGAFVILIAPSERQSKELFRKVLDFRAKTGSGPQALRSTQTELELINGGRLICAPSTSDTIRGFSAVDAIVFDEAAFMTDDLVNAVLPMRAETGRILMSSTPNGAQGLFYELWQDGKVRRIHARSVDIPRLAKKVAFDKAHMPRLRFEVEHLCSFVGSGKPFFNVAAVQQAMSAEVQPLWS